MEPFPVLRWDALYDIEPFYVGREIWHNYMGEIGAVFYTRDAYDSNTNKALARYYYQNQDIAGALILQTKYNLYEKMSPNPT